MAKAVRITLIRAGMPRVSGGRTQTPGPPRRPSRRSRRFGTAAGRPCDQRHGQDRRAHDTDDQCARCEYVQARVRPARPMWRHPSSGCQCNASSARAAARLTTARKPAEAIRPFLGDRRQPHHRGIVTVFPGCESSRHLGGPLPVGPAHRGVALTIRVVRATVRHRPAQH